MHHSLFTVLHFFIIDSQFYYLYSFELNKVRLLLTIINQLILFRLFSYIINAFVFNFVLILFRCLIFMCIHFLSFLYLCDIYLIILLSFFNILSFVINFIALNSNISISVILISYHTLFIANSHFLLAQFIIIRILEHCFFIAYFFMLSFILISFAKKQFLL